MTNNTPKDHSRTLEFTELKTTTIGKKTVTIIYDDFVPTLNHDDDNGERQLYAYRLMYSNTPSKNYEVYFRFF